MIEAQAQTLEPIPPERRRGREEEDRGGMHVVTVAGIPIPRLFASEPRLALRVAEFFGANIRNPNTCRAYLGDIQRFSVWCEKHSITELGRVQPLHAAFLEELLGTVSKPTVKRHLAAVRMLYDWLVLGQVLPGNPASVVRGPKYSVKRESRSFFLRKKHATCSIPSKPAP